MFKLIITIIGQDLKELLLMHSIIQFITVPIIITIIIRKVTIIELVVNLYFNLHHFPFIIRIFHWELFNFQ
jgi:hypothetical protein